MEIIFTTFAVSCFVLIFSISVLSQFETLNKITAWVFLFGVAECMASSIAILLFFSIPLTNWIIAFGIGHLFIIPFFIHIFGAKVD